MCVCVYLQCSQLGHVVEAGQRDEGDVVVVEGAGESKHSQGKKWTKETIFYCNCRQKIDFFLIRYLPNKY